MGTGLRIRKIRRQNKLTQPQLAEKIGVHETTIRRWEKEVDTGPSVTEIQKIADALGTSVSYLIGDTDSPALKTNEIKAPQESPYDNDEDDLDLGYWGNMVERANRAAKSEDVEKLALVAALLQSAAEKVSGVKKKMISQAVQHNNAEIINNPAVNM